jgi:hypothetical protein
VKSEANCQQTKHEIRLLLLIFSIKANGNWGLKMVKMMTPA